jgi:hypothetical protein
MTQKRGWMAVQGRKDGYMKIEYFFSDDDDDILKIDFLKRENFDNFLNAYVT